MQAREPTAAYDLVTAEMLFERADNRCELIDGKVVEMTPSGGRHGRLAAELARRIGNHVHEERCGRVYGAETGFILARDPDLVRAPDVAFVIRQRVIDTEGYLEQAPDLAVEVLSPSDRFGEVDRKVHQWLAAGTRQVWVVDPAAERALIYRQGERSALDLGPGDDIDGAGILPGFSLAIDELFRPVL